MKLFIKSVLLLFALGITMHSCYYDVESELYPNDADCASTDVSYNGRIKAICDANCATSSCHAGPSPASSLALETYDQVRTATENGTLCTIEHISGCSPMPKNEPKMKQCLIDAWKDWKEAGYPEN